MSMNTSVIPSTEKVDGETIVREGGELKVNLDNETLGYDVTDANVQAKFGKCPIGTVLPWLKTLTNTPALPSGWVECDGSTLSDSESVYNGVALPDLNGGNRFLRGSSTSGTTGGADSHSHTTGGPSGTLGGLNPGSRLYGSESHTHSVSSASSLPSYYEVVFIMRVK